MKLNRVVLEMISHFNRVSALDECNYWLIITVFGRADFML